MGGYIGQIGNYSLYLHDSIYDCVKKNKPIEYYENYKVNLTLKNNFNDEEEIEISLLELGKLNKLKKYYKFDFEFNLTKILWNILEERHIKLSGKVFLYQFIDKDNCYYYYLQSKIGDVEVILKNACLILHNLNSYDDIIWLDNHALRFEQI